MKTVYIVATGPKEADYIASEGIGCEDKEESELVLRSILDEQDDDHPMKYRIYKRMERTD